MTGSEEGAGEGDGEGPYRKTALVGGGGWEMEMIFLLWGSGD